MCGRLYWKLTDTNINTDTDIDINECDSSPCENGATCINNNGSFTCICSAGYTGSLCSTDIDECLESPCINGNCPNTEGSFECKCADGYDHDGQLCDKDIDDCASSPCMNGGSCKDSGVASYNCTCANGWTGKTCTNCSLHACTKCEGVPAKCVECVSSYKLNTDGICGEFLY